MKEKSYANRMISVLYRYNQRFFNYKIKQSGLPVEYGQVATLMQVYRNPGISQDEISILNGMDKGTIARNLTGLEKGGLIQRVEDGRDRRINHIYPTACARELYPEIRKAIEELHEILFQDFTEEEKKLAVSFLTCMEKNMTSYIWKKKKENLKEQKSGE